MNDHMQSELRTDEGFRSVVYDDATGRPLKPGDTLVGHPTIGYGRALDVNGLTLEEANALLTNDIGRVERALGRYGWCAQLDPVRRGVMTNLAFNMGVAGLLGFTKMLAALTTQDYSTAATELMHSKWYANAPVARSSRLMRQLRTGAG